MPTPVSPCAMRDLLLGSLRRCDGCCCNDEDNGGAFENPVFVFRRFDIMYSTPNGTILGTTNDAHSPVTVNVKILLVY